MLARLFTNKQVKPGREGGVSLWRQWVRNPQAIRWLIRDEDVLGPEEVSLIGGWAAGQLEWGLHVRVHAGALGLPQVVEVFGPDLMEPHVLLYRTAHGIQVDEAHGESRLCADVAEALTFIVQHT